MKYRPSIIIVPASVIMQWVDQIDHFFKQKRNVMIFWGSSEHVSDTSRKERTVNNWDALRTNLGGLDVDDPETGCTVVITSYQTWA
jgi:SNF2 family DNA or RNA helicase